MHVAIGLLRRISSRVLQLAETFRFSRLAIRGGSVEVNELTFGAATNSQPLEDGARPEVLYHLTG